MTTMLNAAIIGYGGIAQAVHVPGYKSLEKAGKTRLIAARDIDPAQFTKKRKSTSARVLTLP